jgi:broad specificity phosphatase PhoE
MRILEVRRHTMRSKPGQHLSQAGVDLARVVGNRMGLFNRVITSMVPRAFETALAMGYAVDEQLEQLASMGDDVDAEIEWPADFATWGRALRKGGPAAQFAQGLAALYMSIIGTLPEDGAALIISHGGFIEAGAVACLPNADHTAWGPYIRCCEGVRLEHDGRGFIGAQILRVPTAPES